MTKKLMIGTVGFPVSQKLLFAHVDIVEIQETRNAVPKSAQAKKLRAAAPASVSFSVAMPNLFFEPPRPGTPLSGDPSGYGGFRVSEENKRLFERLNRYGDALQADALVLATPPSFTPAAQMQEALEQFLSAMPIEGRTVVWQPSGPWTEEQAAAFAEKTGMIVAVDPIRDAATPGDTAYFRLGPFAAMGSRVGVYDLERIIAAAEEFPRASVVFETERALDDVKNLKQILGER